MRKKCLLIIFVLIIQIVNPLCAGNPVIKGIGMSDPHIRVFNDTIFLYSGHDDKPSDKTWVMKDWRVYSSTDLINWDLRTTIKPSDNYMGENNTSCWACDAAYRNGRYYFYFSDQKRSIGVMVSENPAGPYIDVLGKPLISPMHDPTAFINDNKEKTPYIIYGDKSGGGYHIARLNDDMISLAENPKPIVIKGKEWQDAPIWMDKNYLFKYNGIYYLSWGRDYAISKNIYGPYHCAGEVGEGFNLNEYAHGSFFWWKGQFYHIWTYYIKPGYKFRECVITYCHFADDGSIVTDTEFLDKHFETGVGQYSASWPEIQAEWYSEKSKEITVKGTRELGFYLDNIKDGSWVKFSNVDFGKQKCKRFFSATLSDVSKEGGIEIRSDSLSGKLLGKADFCNGQLLNDKIVITCKMKKIFGKKDIYLKFNGKDSEMFRLDKFHFE